MNLNLDLLRTEIADYLREKGFLVFHGFSRKLDDRPEVEWDSLRYPDYKQFLAVAQGLGVKVVVVHHREFSPDVIDRALDELPASGLEFAEQRQLEQRLRDLRMYEGFTCAVEISFDQGDMLYFFELRTDWYNELNVILEQLDLPDTDLDDQEDEDSPYGGGYYSKN